MSDNNYQYIGNRINTVTSGASSTSSSSSSGCSSIGSCSRTSSTDDCRNNCWSSQINNLQRSISHDCPSSPSTTVMNQHSHHHNHQNNAQNNHINQQNNHTQNHNLQQQNQHQLTISHGNDIVDGGGGSIQRNDWNTLIAMPHLYQKNYLDNPYGSINSGAVAVAAVAHHAHLQNSSSHVYKRYFQTGISSFGKNIFFYVSKL